MDSLVAGDYIFIGNDELLKYTVVQNYVENKRLTFYVPSVGSCCTTLYANVYSAEKRNYTPLNLTTNHDRVVVKNPVLLSTPNDVVHHEFIFLLEAKHPHIVESYLVNMTKKSYIVKEYTSGRIFELRYA